MSIVPRRVAHRNVLMPCHTVQIRAVRPFATSNICLLKLNSVQMVVQEVRGQMNPLSLDDFVVRFLNLQRNLNSELSTPLHNPYKTLFLYLWLCRHTKLHKRKL